MRRSLIALTGAGPQQKTPTVKGGGKDGLQLSFYHSERTFFRAGFTGLITHLCSSAGALGPGPASHSFQVPDPYGPSSTLPTHESSCAGLDKKLESGLRNEILNWNSSLRYRCYQPDAVVTTVQFLAGLRIILLNHQVAVGVMSWVEVGDNTARNSKNSHDCRKYETFKVSRQRPYRDYHVAQTTGSSSNHLYTWQLQTPNTVHIWQGCSWTQPTFSKCPRSRSMWMDGLLFWSHLTSSPSGLRGRLHSWSYKKKKKKNVSSRSMLGHCQSSCSNRCTCQMFPWLQCYWAKGACWILDHATTGFYRNSMETLSQAAFSDLTGFSVVIRLILKLHSPWLRQSYSGRQGCFAWRSPSSGFSCAEGWLGEDSSRLPARQAQTIQTEKKPHWKQNIYELKLFFNVVWVW